MLRHHSCRVWLSYILKFWPVVWGPFLWNVKHFQVFIASCQFNFLSGEYVWIFAIAKGCPGPMLRLQCRRLVTKYIWIIMEIWLLQDACMDRWEKERKKVCDYNSSIKFVRLVDKNNADGLSLWIIGSPVCPFIRNCTRVIFDALNVGLRVPSVVVFGLGRLDQP